MVFRNCNEKAIILETVVAYWLRGLPVMPLDRQVFALIAIFIVPLSHD